MVVICGLKELSYDKEILYLCRLDQDAHIIISNEQMFLLLQLGARKNPKFKNWLATVYNYFVEPKYSNMCADINVLDHFSTTPNN